jgi:hypothetical protein
LNQIEFDAVATKQFDECAALLVSKGNDYSPTKDRLGSFRRASERLGLTMEQILWVYLDKHLQAISSFVARGRVESEPIEGRISDVINYMVLLRAIIEDKKA